MSLSGTTREVRHGVNQTIDADSIHVIEKSAFVELEKQLDGARAMTLAAYAERDDLQREVERLKADYDSLSKELDRLRKELKPLIPFSQCADCVLYGTNPECEHFEPKLKKGNK